MSKDYDTDICINDKNMKHPGQYLINHVYLNDQSRVGLGRSTLAVEGDYA